MSQCSAMQRFDYAQGQQNIILWKHGANCNYTCIGLAPPIVAFHYLFSNSIEILWMSGTTVLSAHPLTQPLNATAQGQPLDFMHPSNFSVTRSNQTKMSTRIFHVK